jgi:rubredoxin/O-antigen/teichoic acid export membrane protein
MASLVRCRACGYVMEERKVGRVCPACGLRRSVFQPYEDKISPTRRFLLNFASILPPLVAVNLLFPRLYGQELTGVICFTALVLPLTSLGALASGLFDARLKLKRLGTPALIRKASIGSSLLLLSGANGLLVAFRGFQSEARIYVLAISLACFVCAVLLGMMGKRLIPVMMPG